MLGVTEDFTTIQIKEKSQNEVYTDEYLMNKTGVTKDLKEEWNWIRYMIGGKMFAAICLDEANENKPVYITLKLESLDGDFLRQQYEDIIPGYYMNKVHWNSVKPNGEVPDDLLMEMLDKSYALVLHGFSRKRQQEILHYSNDTEHGDNSPGARIAACKMIKCLLEKK